MKETLHTFFRRTAFSRDASEFLLQYHSIDRDQFLLMIPVLSSDEACQDFLEELRYLTQLELYPVLLVSDHFVSAKHQSWVEEAFSDTEDSLELFSCAESDFSKRLLELVEERSFYKVMWTGGPLSRKGGDVVSRVYTTHRRGPLSEGSELTLLWLQSFLLHRGPAQSVQLVEPQNILPELFTSRGAGTLVSLGYSFVELALEAIDEKSLRSLMGVGFGRQLRDDYFSKLHHETKVIVEKDGHGAMVLEPWGDMVYLDKVVVEPHYFGRGLGSLLLDELTQKVEEFSGHHPKLCWRARLDNPYLSRYQAMLHRFSASLPLLCGSVSDDRYVYHYIGLSEGERTEVLQRMRERPSSFI